MALEIYWTKQADKKFDKILEYLQTECNQTHINKIYSTEYQNNIMQPEGN